MNALVSNNFGQVSPLMASYVQQQGRAANDELTNGISSGFGIISYRGKVWRIKHRGEERPLMRADGDGARASIEVVIIKSASAISKIFYEDGFVEGSTNPPDCWSVNGITPDAASPKKQCNTCAGCPKNAWGSKITDAGKKGKACADSKRLAIVPLEDIDNEVYGGPLLLRIPAASLQEVAHYGKQMGELGYPYFAIATRISFDTEQAFPKLLFKAIRPLSDAEAMKVLSLRDDTRVSRILDEATENVQHDAEIPKQQAIQQAFEQPPVVAQPFEQPVQQVAPQPVQQPVQQQVAAQPVQQQVAPQPVVQQVAPQPVQQQVVQQVAPQPVQQPVQQAAPQPVQQVVQETVGEAPASFDDMLEGLLG